MSKPQINSVPSESERQWRDHHQRHLEHPGFRPTALQQAFIDVVMAEMGRGVYLLDALNQAARKELAIDPDLARPTEMEGDWLGDMIYKAKRAVETIQHFALQKEVAEQLRLTPDTELGVLMGPDRKLLNACKVVSIDESGITCTLHANRGPKPVALTMRAADLRDAITSAHMASKRKTSFEQFVAARSHLPPVRVLADPREPFYKTPEAYEADCKRARDLYRQADEWKDIAHDFSMRGGPGSLKSLYGFVALAKSNIAEAQGQLDSDRCFGGGPKSDYSKKANALALAQQQLEVFAGVLDQRYPNWAAQIESINDSTGEDAAETQAPEAGQSLASSASEAVLAIARKINHFIGQKVADETRKTSQRAVDAGSRSMAWLQQQVDQVHQQWAQAPLNNRTVALAQAIADGNPDLLVRTWAKEGHGVYGNEGSLTAFRDITGLNLLRMSSQARAQALYQWGQWTPEQVAAHQSQMAQARAERVNEHREKLALSEREHTVQDALRATALGDAGRVMPLKWVLDERICAGFNELDTSMAHLPILVNRTLGQHMPLTKGIVFDYVQAALAMATPRPANAPEADPQEEEQQEPQDVMAP